SRTVTYSTKLLNRGSAMNRRGIFGIDLGTTYSCIAWVDQQGKAVIIPNAEGSLITPSVVYFASANEVVVGQQAKDVASLQTDLCVSTVKRAMGDPHWERKFYGHSYKPQ